METAPAEKKEVLEKEIRDILARVKIVRIVKPHELQNRSHWANALKLEHNNITLQPSDNFRAKLLRAIAKYIQNAICYIGISELLDFPWG